MNDSVQIDLFTASGEAYARHSDPATSHAAAAAAEGRFATEMEGRVLECLRRSNGLNTHEVADLTGIPYWTVTPRIRPLVRKGLVEDSGERRPGPGQKRQCIVWKAT